MTICFFVSLLNACASRQAVNLAQLEANAANVAQPAPTTPDLLTTEAVLDAFKNANLPLTDVIVYTEATDKNNLLGRPHQYVGKINFSDKRVKNTAMTKQGNSIEVFLTQEDLEARKNYTEGISKSGGPFAQYVYSHKNVLLRLVHQILPKDAAQYETILKSL